MGLFDRFRRKPTLESFAAAMIAGMRESGCEDELRYDRDQQAILQVRDGETVGQTNPANMFRTYLDAPEKERPELMRKIVRVALSTRREPPEDYEEARCDLRPRLWSRAMLAFEELRGRSLDLVSFPVGGHLVATLAYDWPDSVQTVSSSQLEAWGVTAYEAFEAARANLSDATEGYAAFDGGLYGFIEGDSYDASRILLTDRITAMEVRGRHVVMAPNRDTLLITGDEQEDGLRKMIGFAEPALAEPYPLVGLPMVFEDGEWIDWLPPEGHPLARRFHEVRTRWLAPDYEEQKQVMEAHHAESGEDLFVASFTTVVRLEDDSLVSYCVWAEGVDSLLPEADKVVLVDAAGEKKALGPFKLVQATAGEWMEDAGAYPPRWRTRGFPTREQLDRIGMGML